MRAHALPGLCPRPRAAGQVGAARDDYLGRDAVPGPARIGVADLVLSDAVPADVARETLARAAGRIAPSLLASPNVPALPPTLMVNFVGNTFPIYRTTTHAERYGGVLTFETVW